MPADDMDVIHIVGAGGIGCAVGYALRSVGVPVLWVECNQSKTEHGNRHGVAVDRRRPLPAEFVPFSNWSPPSNSIVLLCTKCYDNAEVLKKLPVDVRLIPIQNGFDTQLDAFDHQAEGISSFVSECAQDKPHTRMTRKGALHLGGRNGHANEWISQLAKPLRQAGLFRVIEIKDINPIKHTKLMYNAAISPLAAAAGLDNGDLLRIPLARRLFFELLRENYAILRHAGKPLGKVGPFHPDTVMEILDRRWLARLLTWAFYPGLRGTYCSMSGDLPKGRTEIANYNERLIEWADGFSCPLNRRVVDVIREMERDKSVPTIDVLKRFD